MGSALHLIPRYLLLLLVAPAASFGGMAESGLKSETVEVEAPFKMPAIEIPDFSACRRFPITDFGASAGDIKRTSAAVAAAVGKAHATGGGIVLIPPGDWDTGRIHLKSNVNLHLEEGAVLRFSGDPQDYLPAVKTSWEGMECYNYSPLIYAYGCSNVAITGKGKLLAGMDVWTRWSKRPPAHMEALKRLYNMAAKDVPVEDRLMVDRDAHLRPQFIQFNRCEGVLVDGVTIHFSPFWVIHPLLSKNVVIRNVKVWARGHNNDGVDPEMSQNVLIENCSFDQGDDAVSIKAGRNQDAWRLDTPSKNIVIRNCRIKHGHQLLALGSELSGGIENVLVENCHVDKEKANPFHLCFIKTNERRGGYVRNIYMRNITAGKVRFGVLGIETDVLYQWRDLVPTYERRLTPIRGVFLENISAESTGKYIAKIEGQQEMPVRNVELMNVAVSHVGSDVPIRTTHVEGFKLRTKGAVPGHKEN